MYARPTNESNAPLLDVSNVSNFNSLDVIAAIHHDQTPSVTSLKSLSTPQGFVYLSLGSRERNLHNTGGGTSGDLT
jgi:hypothetical protein